MIRGVRTLAERPVGTIIPPRTEIQWIDLGETQEDVRPDILKLDADIWPVRIPTAFSIFPHDIRGGSRRWAERRYERIVAFREGRRGHLTAFQKPELFTAELRTVLRATRRAAGGNTKG